MIVVMVWIVQRIASVGIYLPSVDPLLTKEHRFGCLEASSYVVE